MSLKYDELIKVVEEIVDNEIEEVGMVQCENCDQCERCENVYCPILAENPDVRSCEIQDDVDRMIDEHNTLLEAVELLFGTEGRRKVNERQRILLMKKMESKSE